MDLRDYQKRAVEACREARRRGHRRILFVLATGGGKTVTAVHIICSHLQRPGTSVLVLAHRQELLNQFWAALQREQIPAGIIRADDSRTDASQRVQLASVDTLVRREKPKATLVVVDEAHRTPAGRYTEILSHYPEATVLGLTATPCRLDGSPLKEHYDVLVEGATYSELIELGAIVEPTVYAPANAVDLSGVGKSHGDYAVGELEGAMIHVVGDVVGEWHRHAQGKATVVFAVGVDHSQRISDEFKRMGVRADHLDGTTPEDERLETLVKLETGRLDVVVNVGVLTEGWDQPRVKCCVMARPTLSLTLHMQTAGRILRPWCPEHGSVPRCCAEQVKPVLLDHAGNVARHGMPHEDRHWTLDGKAARVKQNRYITCGGCFAMVETMPCPLCGYQSERKERKLRTAPGQLQQVETKDPKRAAYDVFVARARRQGFKPGFAAAKYKEKFGEWPPWAWKLETEKLLDEEWKTRIARRQAERDFWAGKAEALKEMGWTQVPEEGEA